MIAQLRNALALLRAIAAVPHLIRAGAELELRVEDLERRLADAEAVTRELYVGPIGEPACAASRRKGTPASDPKEA